MKFKHLLFIPLTLFITNVFADPCNYTLRSVNSDNTTFNRIQQENNERLALACQEYQLYKIQEAKDYLDKHIRQGRANPN